MSRLRIIPAVLCLLTSGCGAPPLKKVVDDFREVQGLSFVDCGTVNLAGAACEAITSEEQCLLDAFATCSPAELVWRITTDEGDSLVEHWLVIPDGSGSCTVEKFIDQHRDAFADPHIDIIHSSCATVEAFDTGMCVIAQARQCRIVETW